MWLINTDWVLSLRPWYFFTAGGEAVFLFFVLSGYVLTAGYEKEKDKFSYFNYVIRRVLRIYPAYYFAIAVAIVGFTFIKPQMLVDFSGWFNSQFPSISLDKDTIINTILLVTKSGSAIDCVVWTLTYEIIISIVFLPLLWKFPKTTTIVIAIAFMWLYNLGTYPLLTSSCFYTLFFLIGMMVYKFGHKLQYLAKLRFLPIYLILYAILYFAFGNSLVFHEYLRNITSGLGSVGFILLAIYNPRVIKILESKILLFYGKISYSFYLIHMPIAFILIYSFNDLIPLNIIRVAIFVLASIFAYLMYRFIEKPFMYLGKKASIF